MEVTPLHIYLFSVFDSLQDVSSVVVFLSVVVTGALIVGAFIDGKLLERCDYKRTLKLSAIVLTCSVLINVFVPSGKTMVAMYVVPKAVNSGVVQQLPSEVMDFFKGYLKKGENRGD